MQTTHLKSIQYFSLFLIFSVTFFACSKDGDLSVEPKGVTEFRNNIPLKWNQLYLEIERYCPGYKPPVSARNYAYINFIAYESIVHAEGSEYNTFSGYFNDLFIRKPNVREEYNWEVVLNSAFEKAFELYFPTAPSKQQFQMLEIGSSLRANLQSITDFDVFQRSVQHGEYVAETIYEWSKEDTWGHEGYLKNNDPNYVPPRKIDYWKPTYPDFAEALLPHWGKVRTFAAPAFDNIPPPEFSTNVDSKMYNEATQTMNLVNEIKAGNNEEDYWIAEFWSDDCPILTFSPAGRMVSIANQLIAIEQMNLMESVATYAKLGMALSDAGVKCWGAKYKFNLLRPIDYIREFMGHEDWNTVMCPDGSGGFYTPNFPTYPSGHATFSAAASVVFENVFGDNYYFTDRSHEGRTEFKSQPRSFSTFKEMAYENAYSRVPLGVHFASDSEAGTNLGFAVGENVVDLPWQ